MPSVLIAGGGLAGLSAAAALGGAGFDVDLFEARPFLGGRATSYPIPGPNEDAAETIDNRQHVLLRCCVCVTSGGLYRRWALGSFTYTLWNPHFLDDFFSRSSVTASAAFRSSRHWPERFSGSGVVVEIRSSTSQIIFLRA